MSDTADPGPFVEDLAAMLSGMGFPRMPARVFSALLGTGRPGMTSRDLADELRVSPAAISGAVNYLVRVHLVLRRREPGERADRFSTGTDLWANAMAKEVEGYTTLIRLMDTALDSGDLSPAADARITETRDFFLFMTREMPELHRRWKREREGAPEQP